MAKRKRLRPGRASNEYFLSRRQMEEAKVIEMQMLAKLKRGEIKNYILVKCGCGCGVFASTYVP